MNTFTSKDWSGTWTYLDAGVSPSGVTWVPIPGLKEVLYQVSTTLYCYLLVGSRYLTGTTPCIYCWEGGCNLWRVNQKTIGQNQNSTYGGVGNLINQLLTDNFYFSWTALFQYNLLSDPGIRQPKYKLNLRRVRLELIQWGISKEVVVLLKQNLLYMWTIWQFHSTCIPYTTSLPLL